MNISYKILTPQFEKNVYSHFKLLFMYLLTNKFSNFVYFGRIVYGSARERQSTKRTLTQR